MMLSETILKQTPLYSEHQLLHARIVPFGGWEMPIQYEGILSEYEHTRKGTSLFDTCHMGEFFIEGDFKKSGLDRIVTQRIWDMPLKTCRYGLSLNEQGGVIDDLIVYRLAEEKWMVVVNGATTDKDAAHFQSHLAGRGAFRNASSEIGKLDVQGPQSRDILKKIIPGIEKLEYYTFDYFDFLGQNNIVSRTGYTGELGYEVYFPWIRMKELWKKILENKNVKPAGLGARDVLRLEMGYSLYGQELDEHISPLEAGLSKFIDFEKDFIGQGTLLKQKSEGLKRKLVCFVSQTRQSPRHNHKIFSADAKEAGIVTSGTFSPALKRGIGMGFVASDSGAKKSSLLFGDEKNKVAAEVTGRPFYKNGSLKT